MFVGRISQFQKNSHRKSYIILQIYIGVPWIIILERGVGWGQNKSWCVKDSIFNMNQVKKIGTIRLSTFFFFLLYPNNPYAYISHFLEYTSKKIILRKYFTGIWTPCLHPRSYAYGSFCKLPIILARFGWTLYLLDKFSQNVPISNFMNILPGRPSCSMRIDMMKLKALVAILRTCLKITYISRK